MRFYLILFFCVGCIFISCSEKESIPGDVLTEHQMSLLLTDIHVVDGSIYNLPNTPDTLRKHGLGLYLAVFKLHDTDTTQFKNSLQFYSRHPVLLDGIYAGVTKSLDSLLTAKNKEIAKNAVRKPTASQKTTNQIIDSVKKTQKTDTLKKKRIADSIRTARFKKMTVLTIKKANKSKADSIAKSKKHKHHKQVKPVQTKPDAVPQK